MKLEYESEKYECWVSLDSVSLDRKLVNETAFDGIVKIYSLKSNDSVISSKLENNFFGDFIHYANCGVFLRMFESKTSWPITKLVYLDFVTYDFIEIKTTNSSWNKWYGSDLGYGKHLIEISPTEKIEYQIQSSH
jgi:hypothetical protein